ncbi:MAG: carboxypeptidase regulatory-like domain-containing protein [Pirellulaceae bacterium]
MLQPSLLAGRRAAARRPRPLPEGVLLPTMRSRRVAVWSVIGLLMLGAAIGLASLIYPPPAPFLVFVCSDRPVGSDLTADAAVVHDRESLLLHHYFRTAGKIGSSGAVVHRIEAQLADLSLFGPGDTVVVYVTGHSHVDQQGRICLNDASQNSELAARILLRDVLLQVRRCAARNKLVVLDIVRPIHDPILDLASVDVASRIPAEVAAVDDPHRLTLTSCSPGQTALNSESFRRTGFGYYFEMGLRGAADGWNGGDEYDGRVSARELHQFVRDHVGRWAAATQGVEQTPLLLGDAPDFNVIAVSMRESHTFNHPIEQLPSRDYPQWLVDAWTRRDAMRAGRLPDLQPRFYLHFEHAVQMAERQWRDGAQGDLVNHDLQVNLSLIEKRIEQSHIALALATPQSLAMLREQGHVADPTVAQQLAPIVKQIQSPAPGQTPDKAAAQLAQLIDKFNQATAKSAGVDVALAAVDALYRSTEPTPVMVTTLDQLIAHRQPQPQFVETYFVRRLAGLAAEIPASAWQLDVVRQAIRVMRLGELAMIAGRSFVWTQAALTTASQLRHEGEVLLLNPGYAPAGDAAETFSKAQYQLEGVVAHQATIREAYNALDEARRRLPQYGAYLQYAPEMDIAWRRAIQFAHQLDASLAFDFDQPPLDPDALGERIETVRQQAAPLADSLEALARPWTDEQVQQLCRRGAESGANAAVARQMRALLETPWLDADGRRSLWLALQDLELRLHMQVLAEDRRTADITDFDACSLVAPGEADSAALQRRIGWAIDLLLLGDFPHQQYAALQQRLAALEPKLVHDKNCAANQSLYELASDVSEAYCEFIPARLETLTTPAQQVQLAAIVPIGRRVALLDEPGGDPYTRYRADFLAQRRNWLVEHYLYLARDIDGAAFNAGVARQYIAAGGRSTLPFLLLQGPDVDDSLTWSQPGQTCVVGWKRIRVDGQTPPMPNSGGSPGATSAEAQPPEVDVLTPSLLLDASASATPTTGGGDIDVELKLVPASDAEQSTLARGVMLKVTSEGRVYHHRIALPVLSAGPQLRVLLSADPAGPTSSLDRLRLRPAEQLQPYYAYISNPTDDDREVIAVVSTAPQPSPPIAVPAGATVKLAFPPQPPKPGAPLPILSGPLTIQLLDAKTKQSLSNWTYPLDVVSPRQYARVMGSRFVPQQAGVNQLTVTLQAYEMPPGPPCMVELVLSADDIPGLVGVTSGVLRGVLPADGAPLTLTARNLLLAEGYDTDGAFHLNVDGVERTYRYEADFSRRGDSTSPWESMRPRVIIVADQYARSAPGFKVGVHVDNAADGSQLELAVGQRRNGVFIPDLTQTSDRTKIPAIAFTPTGQDGAFLFSVTLHDWSTEFDATGIVGRRIVRARLIDPLGVTARTAEWSVVFDDTPPRGLAFLKAPPQAVVNQPIDLLVQGVDDISGVADVNFFVGKPTDGNPPQGAKMIPAKPVGGNLTQWQANLPGQKEAGPIDVTAQFTNHVGESSHLTTSIEITDQASAPAGAVIVGSVTEGSRPQAGLQVVLADDQKNVQGTTKTDAQGRYEFKGVKPGKYTVSTVKESSQRQAQAEVEAQTGQTANVDLALTL